MAGCRGRADRGAVASSWTEHVNDEETDVSSRDRIEGKAREVAGKLAADDELAEQGRTDRKSVV